MKETRLKSYGNLRRYEPGDTLSFHDPTLGDIGEAESESQYVNSGWRVGRRVVELCTLAENLAQCSAQGCDLLQDLRNTLREYRYGLGSLLWIQCSCGQLNKVHTGKFHYEEKAAVYDVNTKMAAGMLHSGMSPTAI